MASPAARLAFRFAPPRIVHRRGARLGVLGRRWADAVIWRISVNAAFRRCRSCPAFRAAPGPAPQQAEEKPRREGRAEFPLYPGVHPRRSCVSYETPLRRPPSALGRDAVGAEAAGGPSRRDFRFRADCVCFTPSSGRGRHPRRMSQVDPTRTLAQSVVAAVSNSHSAGLGSQLVTRRSASAIWSVLPRC